MILIVYGQLILNKQAFGITLFSFPRNFIKQPINLNDHYVCLTIYGEWYFRSNSEFGVGNSVICHRLCSLPTMALSLPILAQRYRKFSLMMALTFHFYSLITTDIKMRPMSK